jgi:hypothetical protein
MVQQSVRERQSAARRGAERRKLAWLHLTVSGDKDSACTWAEGERSEPLWWRSGGNRARHREGSGTGTGRMRCGGHWLGGVGLVLIQNGSGGGLRLVLSIQAGQANPFQLFEDCSNNQTDSDFKIMRRVVPWFHKFPKFAR